MNIEICPELEQIIQELIASGQFACPTEVVEAGVRRLAFTEELTEQDILDIKEAERQIDAGEFFTVEQVRKEFLGTDAGSKSE